MYDPNFELKNSDNSTGRRILIASVLTIALAVGAIYGSVMWGNSPLAAQTTTVSTNNAQPLQLDSSLFQDQQALADLYDAVAPSVVSIQVLTTEPQTTSPFQLPGGEGIPSAGQGSGFIYDNEGHIVTNNHVVEDADEITVLFTNGFWAEAEIVATDPQADLAVIKVDPPEDFDWQPLPLATPDTLRVGHFVIALGNPFGLDSTMTTGIVSALGRDQRIGEGETRYTLPEIIQTDAAINPGNSGGPLINLNGEVVGVNFAIQSSVRSNSGVGFTIPISIVQRVVPSLIENGEFRYSFLGISGSQIGPGLAEELELPINRLGVYVSRVIEGGPSEEAGLRGDSGRTEANGDGDIITAINGEIVRTFEDLVGYLVTETSPGDTVTITALRDGDPVDFDVTLVDRPGLPSLASSRGGDNGGDDDEEEDNSRRARLTARAAIAIAVDAAGDEGMAEDDIVEKIAQPDEIDGDEVWIVELSTSDEVATVTVDRSTGDVLEIEIE